MKQTLAVVEMSLRSIGGRLPTALVIVTSIGGVVAILIGLLAMSAGFRAALVDTAKADRALVLRGSSSNERRDVISGGARQRQTADVT